MIKIFYFVFLFVVNRVSYKIHKDVLHPIFICSAMWFVLPLLYELLSSTSSNYYVLSDKFYAIIISFFISFILFTIFIVKGHCRKGKITINDIPTEHIHNLLHFCMLCNFIVIIRILLLCRTVNIAYAIMRFRVIVTETPYMISPDIKLLLYIFSITPPLFCYIFLFRCKVKKLELVLFSIEFLLMTLLYVSKGRMMKYFIMIFCILLLKNKLNLRTVLFSIGIVFGLIFFMTMSRDKNFMKNFTFLDYIFVYVLSPLPAFDMLINGKVDFGGMTNGIRTFIFPLRVFSKFTGWQLPVFDKMFINIPAKQGAVPTNVYTSLSNSYMDFGNFGCMIYGLLVALCFGTAYRMFAVSKKKEYTLFYLLIVYCIVFQFFGDLFFAFFSMVIQDFICAIIVVRKFKTGRKT